MGAILRVRGPDGTVQEIPAIRGQAATIKIVGTETLAPGQPAAVEEAEGSTPQARKYIFKAPQGPAGEAATVEITDIETLAPGEPATLTEAEDSTPAHRKYVIGVPQGRPGKDGLGVPVPTAEDVGKVPTVNAAGDGYDLETPATGGEEWKSIVYDFSQEYAASVKLELPSANIKEGFLHFTLQHDGVAVTTTTNFRIYCDREAVSGANGFMLGGAGLHTTARTGQLKWEALSDHFTALSGWFHTATWAPSGYDIETKPTNYLYIAPMTSGVLIKGSAVLYYR